MQYHDYAMHGSDGPHVFAWLLLVLLLAVLVGLIVVVATRWGGVRGVSAAPAPAGPRTGDDPQELVRLRYARGEIDRETFLQVSQDLGGPAPPG
jgi:putative membrane protein